MNEGYVISISGLDGAGKSTQERLLIQKLSTFEKPIRYVKVRIGFTKGIRLLRGSQEKRRERKQERRKSGVPKSATRKKRGSWVYKLYLEFALLDLVWALLRIRWMRWRGDVVVCDRYLWDNYVQIKEKRPYLNLESMVLWKAARRLALKPDFPALLWLSPEEAYDRIIARANGTESQSLDELAKRNALYESVKEQAGWIFLPATKSIEELEADIWQRVQQVIS